MLRSVCSQLHARMVDARRFFDAIHNIKIVLGGSTTVDGVMRTWFPNVSVPADIHSHHTPLLAECGSGFTIWNRMGICGDMLVAFRSLDLQRAKAVMREAYARNRERVNRGRAA